MVAVTYCLFNCVEVCVIIHPNRLMSITVEIDGGKRMKYILIIGDGMADDPLPELGGKTPLEVCKKPFFDSLSERGTLGLV